ncbi:MAG: RNA polymerase sigma factor, partial [Croceimicrobium sp.]
MSANQEHQMVDHLFRHQYGKMVAILAKIFGPNHLDLIEDALQDTFLKASLQWRKKQPEAPEAWFIAAARNRVLDLLRQVQS